MRAGMGIYRYDKSRLKLSGLTSGVYLLRTGMLLTIILFYFLISFRPGWADSVIFPGAEGCKVCHERQYREWKESFHAKSLTTPTFRAMATIFYYNVKAKSPAQRRRWGENLEYCINCHAPQTRFSKEQYPQIAKEILSGERVSIEGITCATCHFIKHVKDIPDPGIPVDFETSTELSYHSVRNDNIHRKAILCSACHDYNNPHAEILGDPVTTGAPCCTVYRDYKNTSFARKGITCQSCHMGDYIGIMDRPWWRSIEDRLFRLTGLYRYVDDRKYVNHTMPGAHFEEMLKKAVKMEMKYSLSGREFNVTVRIKNRTPHSIPNGCPPRSRIFLRFWVEDEEGNFIYSDMRKYGINLVDPQGNEPAMVDSSAGRHDFPIPAENAREEKFTFELPDDLRNVKMKATLTYILFVTPPPEAKDRMQKWIIERIRRAKSQREKDLILNQEIPDRMSAMNTLESTYPPVIMAKISEKVNIGR